VFGENCVAAEELRAVTIIYTGLAQSAI